VVKKRGNSWWVVVYTGRDPLTGKKRQRPARPRPEPRPGRQPRTSRDAAAVTALPLFLRAGRASGLLARSAERRHLKVAPFGTSLGGDLLSHPASQAVPSALEGLTSGFGMGPDVSPRHTGPSGRGHRSSQVLVRPCGSVLTRRVPLRGGPAAPRPIQAPGPSPLPVVTLTIGLLSACQEKSFLACSLNSRIGSRGPTSRTVTPPSLTPVCPAGQW
jgi:hypothetical protein